MVRRNYSGFPIDVTVLNRLPQGDAFDLHSRSGDVVEIGQRHGRHAEALLVFDLDQADSGQPRQRFAEGDDSRPVPLTEITELQPLPRLESAGDDVSVNAVDERGRQSFRPSRFAVDPKVGQSMAP
jgi:hypothetical protein